MKLEEIKKIIQEELDAEIQETYLTEVSSEVAKKIRHASMQLANFWKKAKMREGVQEFVLDQGVTELLRGILSTFASINKKVDRGEYGEVANSKTHAAGDVATGHMEGAAKVYNGESEISEIFDKKALYNALETNDTDKLIDINDWAVNEFRKYASKMSYNPKHVIMIEKERLEDNDMDLSTYIRTDRTDSPFRLDGKSRILVWTIIKTQKALRGAPETHGAGHMQEGKSTRSKKVKKKV